MKIKIDHLKDQAIIPVWRKNVWGDWENITYVKRTIGEIKQDIELDMAIEEFDKAMKDWHKAANKLIERVKNGKR